VKSHSIYLRTGCQLPDGIALIQERFCDKWMSVDDSLVTGLDVKLRNAGWHFMWFGGAYGCRGFGRTERSAISRATALALKQLAGCFNAAELDSVSVTKYLVFQVAKVRLHARQVQEQAFFSRAG
jgi:hypothetical protein